MEARNGRLQAALNGIQPATCQGIKRHQVQVVGYIKRRSVRVFQQGAVKSHLAHMLPVRNAAYMLQVLKRWRQCWNHIFPVLATSVLTVTAMKPLDLCARPA